MATFTNILVVDDDPAIVRLLELVLQEARFKVYSTASGEHVAELIQQHQPQLILLDIELPDTNGIDLVTSIRQYSSAPIMMISGRNSDFEKISSFNSGADDYLVKPFSVAELVARVQALLRRSQMSSRLEAATIESPAESPVSSELPSIHLEAEQRRAFVGSTELTLTQKEFHLLELLVNEKGKTLSRELILDKIWGINNVEIETRAVDACVSRLRKKVKSVIGDDVIEAIPGFGYRLNL